MTAPITPDPVALGRQRLDASRLGTLAARETDRDLLAIRDLVAEVERLRAATSPAWDEDTVRAKVADTLRMFLYAGSGDPDHEIDTTAADVLAVVRRHLPVRPDREAIAQAVLNRYSSFDHLSAYGIADAVLDLWPGESRAQVEAAALRDAATRLVAEDNNHGDWWDDVACEYCTPAEWLRARADRIEKGDTR